MLFAKSDILLGLCIVVTLSTQDYGFSADSISVQETQSVRKKATNVFSGQIINLTFKSKIDGKPQPLLIKMPEGYTPEKKWPLLVTLHGLGDGPILATEVESMIQIGPHGRGSVWFTGIGAQDVFECIEIAKELFSVDEDRLYLCGFSMGAAATFNLGLKYPDMWAACVPVCGWCEDSRLIENARHLPFWINTGSKDTMVLPESSKDAYDTAQKLGFSHWKYTEYENMGHDFAIDWKGVEKWLLTKKRTVHPKQVMFRTKDLNSNSAYWVEIVHIEEYGMIARIVATIEKQKVNIITDNVSNYSLRLNNSPIDLAKEIEVVENDRVVFKGLLDKNGQFIKTKPSSGLFKRPGLSGPLWDIYSGSCVLVYGTNSEDESLIKAAKSCADSFSNPRWMNKVDFRIIPDVSVTNRDIMENNLVLFGNVDTNKILAEISGKIPIEMNGNCIVVKGVEYSGEDIGYVLIYPNPLNIQKYVAIFSGNTPDAIDCFDRIWSNFNSMPKGIDVGTFEFVGEDNTVKWHLKEVFEANWNWSSRSSKGLSRQ